MTLSRDIVTTEDEFALETRLYVVLRRASGRVIDLVWFRQNREYADAILDYAESISDRDAKETAKKLRFYRQFSH
ncbi:hypothetical protein [Agitococcus lubricus]|uniref:Uncharacterized protein n=1 Tax=Agitococcus lubricus TaxID=1077255 RepID=A0A2T5IZS5_9GAMM|nr:hypothetical protein [Agitococcus lubricus]PTQ89542.1 hypothetical protein C8N29_10673 [Agitococcus lubricus]